MHMFDNIKTFHAGISIYILIVMLPLYMISQTEQADYSCLSNLQESSEFTVSVRDVHPLFPLFLIPQGTDDITKCKKSLVNMYTYS